MVLRAEMIFQSTQIFYESGCMVFVDERIDKWKLYFHRSEAPYVQNILNFDRICFQSEFCFGDIK